MTLPDCIQPPRRAIDPDTYDAADTGDQCPCDDCCGSLSTDYDQDIVND